MTIKPSSLTLKLKTKTMEKSEIVELLQHKFEPELAEAIAQFKLTEFTGNYVFGSDEATAHISFIPLVIKGNIRTVKHDALGRELLIYQIQPLQSCILSINATYNQHCSNVSAYTTEPTFVILIPSEFSNTWIEKYQSWRKFVFGLYDERLQELLQQHDDISQQKDDIERHQSAISDSIRYAQRIQAAILPPEELIGQLVPDYFVLFQPRDVVSGDYYWVHSYGKRTAIAVADCTGHGVPGAFMSMLGVSTLNNIALDGLEWSAAEFLNEMRKSVKRALRQTGKDDEAKDGMDMVLILYDRANYKLQFAGAYNPIFIIRNNEIIELKADRMPIGIHYVEKESFTNHEFNLISGDRVYAFSDGYADQFGGNENTKFKIKNFKQLLLGIHHKPMPEQETILRTTIEQWRGEHQQVDDILVMGFAVN